METIKEIKRFKCLKNEIYEIKDKSKKIGNRNFVIMACRSGSKEKPKICIEENSSKNRARIIFCSSVLNDLYYFVLDDSDKFSKDEYWSEFRKVKKLLYPYSDKFYDGLLEKNIGNCC